MPRGVRLISVRLRSPVVTIKLKKILSDQETRSIVSQFTALLGAPIAIEDPEGALVVGERNDGSRHPIEFEIGRASCRERV